MKNPSQHVYDSLPQAVLTHIQHLERMRQDFVANVSHELRTPLTVIHGYLEILLEKSNSSQTNKMYKQMHQQTTRMQNLIADLLLLASLEQDELKKELIHIVNVSKLLKTITEEARALSGNKHKFQLQSDPSINILGNDHELRALFSNIIFNAVKYTPAGGHIDIIWEKKGNKVIFNVCDTGIGIAKKHIPRITERFYRVDKGRSRENGGTGLGLAIAKHVLIRHDGKFKIQSTLNKGSNFSCIFPTSRIAHA